MTRRHPPLPPVMITPIGVVHSVFKKKFGIPRQPGLAADAKGKIELIPPFNNRHFIRGLEGFSHIWVIFLFHEVMEEGWNPTVRPPRLGGRKRVGVFASRSPFRPNSLGISCVRLDEITTGKGTVFLHLKGLDILDGTPVVDIKPYVPYSDAISDAKGGYAEEAPGKKFDVCFSDEALAALERMENPEEMEALITDLIAQDPRPGFYLPHHNRQDFVLHLGDETVTWCLETGTAIVLSIGRPETD